MALLIATACNADLDLQVCVAHISLTATIVSQVSIQRVWERDSRTVVVRWSLRCFPRILDNVMGTMVNLDGLSEYHFNDAGFVQMHKVTLLRKHTLMMPAFFRCTR